MLDTEVLYGPWLPSAPDYRKGGLVVANNVIPRPGGGYGPFPSGDDTGDNASDVVVGATSFWKIDGTVVFVGATNDSLFVRTPSVVTETTSGVTAIDPTDAWDFAQFNDFIFAANQNNPLKYLSDIDTETTWATSPGSPPRASVVERVGQFLMLGGIESQPNRIQWSPRNDPTGTWGTDRLTQAGFADLRRDFGRVTRIVGGRFPVVFQERGIHAIRYVGPPTVWAADEIEQSSGCVAPWSVVTAGFRTFFLSQDGFKATNASEVVNIGAQRINQWFFETVNPARINQVQGAVDWPNQCVVWAFASAASDVLDRLLIYSWQEDRWTSGTLTLQWLVSAQLDYVTLEQIGALYPDLDVDVPASLDSSLWQGKYRGLAIWQGDDGSDASSLYMLRGTPLQADFQTAEFAPSPGRRSFVTRAWPLIEDATQASTFAVVTRGNDGAKTTSAYSAIGVDGAAPLRADGRQVALAHRIPAGTSWNDAQGAQVRFRVSGRR